jgi:thymidylate synthase
MRIYKGKSFADVYKQSLTDLIKNPEYSVSPRGLKINEIMNVAHVVERPDLCLYKNKKRSSQLKYIAAETAYYFSGRKDLEFISRFAPFWNQIANTDNTVNSAYGHLIFKEKGPSGFTQWQWAYNSLIQDRDTRQAIILFNKPNYQYTGNKDFICTLNGVFNIRDNKLNFTIQMRSNDAILGTATDFSFFCLLQMQMLKLLKANKYPELELGTFTHLANSYHVYEKHFDMIEEMIASDFTEDSFPEITSDFIKQDGESTDQLNELILAIDNKNTEYESADELFRWIFEKSTK